MQRLKWALLTVFKRFKKFEHIKSYSGDVHLRGFNCCLNHIKRKACIPQLDISLFKSRWMSKLKIHFCVAICNRVLPSNLILNAHITQTHIHTQQVNIYTNITHTYITHKDRYTHTYKPHIHTYIHTPFTHTHTPHTHIHKTHTYNKHTFLYIFFF